MSDYTPGPWRVGTNGPNGLLTVGTERGLMVAMVAHSIYVPDQAEQARGDARLISAAPDLLAAAEGVLNDAYMPDLISGGHVCLNCNFNLNSGEHHAECPIPALAAAIKKAKGQG